MKHNKRDIRYARIFCKCWNVKIRGQHEMGYFVFNFISFFQAYSFFFLLNTLDTWETYAHKNTVTVLKNIYKQEKHKKL